MIAPDRTAGTWKIPPLSLLRAFWKRKRLAGTVTLVAAAVAVVVVYRLPAVYRSETLILVESQRIPEEFVKSTVETNLQDRLSSLSQQILSYTRLLEVVNQFDLYREERASLAEEQIIEKMRSDIDLTVEKGWAKDRPGAFRIAYEGRDPKVVERVANRLGSLFIEENLKTREVQALGTSEFLDTQLAEAAKRLQEQEARLGQYKLKYSGQLPQQENALIAELSRLQVQLQGIQDAINRTQQGKLMTESALAAAEESESALEQITKQVSAGAESPAELSRSQSLGMVSSESIERELDMLRTRYTDNHPAVKAAQELLAKAREREAKASAIPALARNAGEAAAGTADQAKEAAKSLPLSQSVLKEKERIKGLRAQREVAVQQLSALETDRKALLKRIEAVQARVSTLPIREQELATVTRDYEISKANYQSLLDKKLAAQMATEMERNQKSERFRVLDAARVPERPIWPNRPLFGAAGGLVAVVLGIGLGLGVELPRGVVLGEWEMPKDVPVLGRIPVIPEEDASRTRSRKRRKLCLAAALGMLLLAAAGAVGVGLYFQWFSI
jgi:polysaccharide chain length determinant protein (PEP-CTERM system associated)